jgi:hypothetical protein
VNQQSAELAQGDGPGRQAKAKAKAAAIQGQRRRRAGQQSERRLKGVEGRGSASAHRRLLVDAARSFIDGVGPYRDLAVSLAGRRRQRRRAFFVSAMLRLTATPSPLQADCREFGITDGAVLGHGRGVHRTLAEVACPATGRALGCAVEAAGRAARAGPLRRRAPGRRAGRLRRRPVPQGADTRLTTTRQAAQQDSLVTSR